RKVLALCAEANYVGDIISELAHEARDQQQALLLAGRAHRIAIEAVSPEIFGQSSRPMKARRTDDGSCAWSAIATRTMALTACACWERSIGWPSASCVFKCCKVTAVPAKPSTKVRSMALSRSEPPRSISATNRSNALAALVRPSSSRGA